ncbi:unnamed protein product [Cercospora beticola]|nr:unnamed protein product [Cercospora beticola]
MAPRSFRRACKQQTTHSSKTPALHVDSSAKMGTSAVFRLHLVRWGLLALVLMQDTGSAELCSVWPATRQHTTAAPSHPWLLVLRIRHSEPAWWRSVRDNTQPNTISRVYLPPTLHSNRTTHVN